MSEKRKFGIAMSVIAIFFIVGISGIASASELSLPVFVGDGNVSNETESYETWWKGMSAEKIAKELLRDDLCGYSYSVEEKGNMFMELAVADPELAGKVFNHMSILDIKKTRGMLEFTGDMWKDPSVLGKALINADPDHLADVLDHEWYIPRVAQILSAIHGVDPKYCGDFLQMHTYLAPRIIASDKDYFEKAYTEAANFFSKTDPMIAASMLIEIKETDKAAGMILEKLAETDLQAHAKIMGWLWVLG